MFRPSPRVNMQCSYCTVFATTVGKSLCSRVMFDSGCRPTQARKMLVKQSRCLANALTTGVPGGVRGA